YRDAYFMEGSSRDRQQLVVVGPSPKPSRNRWRGRSPALSERRDDWSLFACQRVEHDHIRLELRAGVHLVDLGRGRSQLHEQLLDGLDATATSIRSNLDRSRR